MQDNRRTQSASVRVQTTPDHWLIVLAMILIFILMMSGIIAVIAASSADKTLIISLVALGSQALGRFAAVPAFPALLQVDPQIASTAAAVAKEAVSAAATAAKSAGGGTGSLHSGDELVLDAPGATPSTPVTTGDSVILTKNDADKKEEKPK